MDRGAVQEWLDAYIAAWKSYDREQIGALFTDDAEYRWHPYDDPVRGREAILEGWFDDTDAPGTYDATYAPAALDGDLAVATGTSTYLAADRSVDKVYDNCFLIRFAPDGRCREFTEWFMERP
jgi:ketosteroid isomerase-like protein